MLELGTKVTLTHLRLDGTIVAQYITFGCVQYKVEYLDKVGVVQEKFVEAQQVEVVHEPKA